MSVASAGLSVLAYASGFTLWHYRTQASLAEVTEPGHFCDRADVLANGDMLLVSAADGAQLLCVGVRPHQVTAIPVR